MPVKACIMNLVAQWRTGAILRAMRFFILTPASLLAATTLFFGAGPVAVAEVAVQSTNYVIIAPTVPILNERQRQLEWSARIFETLMGVKAPRGRVTLKSAPAGSVMAQGGAATALMNAFPLTPQPAAPDGTYWNLEWFSNENAAAMRPRGVETALTHEAAHLQFVFAVNFNAVDVLRTRFNGYGSFLPDWIDEAVAVFHEPDSTRAERRKSFKLNRRIPLRTFFTMDHPGSTGTAQVLQVQGANAEEIRKKVEAFQASQQQLLTETAEMLADDAVSAHKFYTQALAIIEYMTARGGYPFFRYVVVQQAYGKPMEQILREWFVKQREIVARRGGIERTAAQRGTQSWPVTKGDPAGPMPPWPNTVGGVLVRIGEAVNPMPITVESMEDDFVEWVKQNYPKYRPNLPAFPKK